MQNEDPDLDLNDGDAVGTPVPLHLRWSSIALVFVGGTIGSAIREGLSLAFPANGGVPVTIPLINLTGAFLLGFLLEFLARTGADTGARRSLRLFLGTGAIGGYTTYSALAADTAGLIGSGSVLPGIAYGLTTVLCGALTTWAGIILGARVHTRRGHEHGGRS